MNNELPVQELNLECICGVLGNSVNLSGSLSAWDNFEYSTIRQNKTSKKVDNQGRSKRPWPVRSKYGFETLEEKYKFRHYDDIARYVEEYRMMFSVAVRTKRSYKPLYPRYDNIRPPSRTSSQNRGKPRAAAVSGVTETSGNKVGGNDYKCNETNSIQGDTKENADQNLDTIGQSLSFLTAAPPLSAGIDYANDNIEDQSEDDIESGKSSSPPKVPLLKRLNTFFFSKNGRKRTSHSTMNSLFPNSHELVDMTPASLINYKVPVITNRPTSHPMNFNPAESKHSVFMPMLERQTTFSSPVKMKLVHNTSINENDTRQYTETRRYRTTNPKLSHDERLPSSHVLQAKPISSPGFVKPVEQPSTSSKQMTKRDKDYLEKIGTEKQDANQIIPERTKLGESIHRLILNYNPYLSNVKPTNNVKSSYGKAELVDYGTQCKIGR